MNTQERADIVLTILKKLYPEPKPSLDFSNDWELIVAVALSAQTTDKQVNKVTKELFKKYKTLDDYLAADPAAFTQDISSIGLYKSKAKNMLAAAKLYDELFGRQTPKTINELTQLPGVGRKTANVVLGNAHGIAEGIAVDTHVKRLANKFGLTTHSDVKKIEQDLMELIPQDDWFLFTVRMIEYGREHSPARKVHDNSDPISQAFM